ncbi:fimbrial protein [Yersinia massiliensis]|uniref:fimbrial protein n=1 Tax=Yersinia massiliensis TaxID=419257 RepID=UPI0012E03B6D|nr:fimbrial protein [Yersinia massiliensis]
MTDKISTTGFTGLRIGLCLLSLGVIMPLQATIIEIGSGSQQWAGPAFNQSISTSFDGYYIMLNPNYGFVAITGVGIPETTGCVNNTALSDVGGVQGYKIAQGIFLVPQASFTMTYELDSGSSETMSGTFSHSGVQGVVSGNAAATPPNSAWCLSPRGAAVSPFFKEYSVRSGSITGNWTIITDGTQQDGTYPIPEMYFSSSALSSATKASILTGYQVKVSTRQCSININKSINFGEVEHNSTFGAELELVKDSLVVGCTQNSANPTANINIKFQANSELYSGEATRLSLNEGGGYITGEITGVTGAGTCNLTQGLKFNGEPLKLGSINAGESSETFSNELIWRLCSGGDTLPAGNVTASATADIIFN